PLMDSQVLFPFSSSESPALTSSVYATAHQLLLDVVPRFSDLLWSYDDVYGLNAAKGLKVVQCQTRSGAGTLFHGYSFHAVSSDKPVAAVVPSPALLAVAPALTALSSSAYYKPLVIHAPAQTYALNPDYVSALTAARSTGIPLILSQSAAEIQPLSVLATALASLSPILHTYSGARLVTESLRNDTPLSLDQSASLYAAISKVAQTFPSASAEAINTAFATMNSQLGTSILPITYTGPKDPETVVITFGSSENSVFSSLASQSVGVIAIRVYSPLDDEKLYSLVPQSARSVLVLGQVLADADLQNPELHSLLYSDISTALRLSGFSGKLFEFKYSPALEWTPASAQYLLDQLSAGFHNQTDLPALKDLPAAELQAKEFVFWDADNSPLISSPGKLARVFSLDPAQYVAYKPGYNTSIAGGTFRTDLRLSSAPVEAQYPVSAASLVVVRSLDLLNSVDLLSPLGSNGKVLLFASGSDDEIVAKLPSAFRRAVLDKNATVYVFDVSRLGEHPQVGDRVEPIATHFAFWKLAFPEQSFDRTVTQVITAFNNEMEFVGAVLAKLGEAVYESGLRSLEVTAAFKELSDDEPVLPEFSANSLIPNGERNIEEPTVQVVSKLDAIKRIAFKEAYGTEKALRPDLTTKTFEIKVRENKPVTPSDYDRYIFHIEFDLTGTDLKYGIGEALGIHAPNDADEVDEFISWYNLKGEDVVVAPSRDDPENHIYAQTIRQVLINNVDLLGRPLKKFYEGLTAYATDAKQKMKLEALTSPAGAAELKKRSEEDFLTHVDVLKEFDSAHPPIEDLLQLIPPLKRREYSIASSQKVHPHSLHLLIVVVDWVDSRGRRRYGHCSKYLADLAVGSKVIVSVKPSVMKLPPSPKTPIIMSGLGTGLAPFKAFLEEKQWQKDQGHDVGEVYLYLGSRHRRQEYLYGEEWEGYLADGLLTHLGAAFSRDQAEKIYIQDRMRQSMDELVDLIGEKGGYFYLCGPTWPVPNITSILEEVITTHATRKGHSPGDMRKVIEELKETGRYVLEVY
ncbi:hypothetical protein CANCADRAFT_11548, partial [Tortispora caseinolytica NRRL Y-17796]